MITNISWTDYLTAMLLLLAVYYLYIGFRYYSKELKMFGSNWGRNFHTAQSRKIKKGERSIHSKQEEIDNRQSEYQESEMAEITALEVEHLVSKVKDTVAKASLHNAGEKECKEKIREVLCRYPEIKASAFQEAVNELIISECEKYGSIKLREDEVVMLWDDV